MLAILAAVTATAIWASAAGGVTAGPGCPSFADQADAQERFFALGGSPARNAGGWDDDRDGVACEGLPGPYAGYATIGYHRERKFLYGTATMPTEADGEGFACLLGNRQFADGARRLTVYRALPGPDKAISRPLKAEPRPGSGRLLWKLERDLAVAGRYYAIFEAQIHLSPYKPSNCPEFGSRETLLPRPPRATPSPRSGPPRRPRLRAPAPR
ncbi:MAG TPA: hypothetical protein VIS95_02080 [Solirubrobacterales bacterium]